MKSENPPGLRFLFCEPGGCLRYLGGLDRMRVCNECYDALFSSSSSSSPTTTTSSLKVQMGRWCPADTKSMKGILTRKKYKMLRKKWQVKQTCKCNGKWFEYHWVHWSYGKKQDKRALCCLEVWSPKPKYTSSVKMSVLSVRVSRDRAFSPTSSLYQENTLQFTSMYCTLEEILKTWN